MHESHMQALNNCSYRKLNTHIFKSLARLLDNLNPYLSLCRFKFIITCILVSDNVRIGFLVRKVAPGGKMRKEMKSDPENCSRAWPQCR